MKRVTVNREEQMDAAGRRATIETNLKELGYGG
jgi:hypothetical protein